MNKFMSLATFLVPVAAIAVFWAELVVKNRWQPALYPVVVTISGCVSWIIKDTAFTRTLQPILIGCLLGSIIAFFFIAPMLAGKGVHYELEEIKQRNPFEYDMVTRTTMGFSIRERHRDNGVKIALPFGFFLGGFLGGLLSATLLRRRQIAENTAC